MKCLIMFAAICIAVTFVPHTLLSKEIVALPAIQKEKADFIAASLSSGAPEEQVMLMWESYVSTSSGENIMEVLFYIFQEAIEETNEDKAYWLEKLKQQNDISEALGDYLEELNEGPSLPPSNTTPTKMDKFPPPTYTKKVTKPSPTDSAKRASYIVDMICKMSNNTDDD